VDSLNSLAAGLQKLLQNYGQNVVLVLEGIDRQRGASQTLLPALTRLGETVHETWPARALFGDIY
jgi:hypothetical protein